MISFVASAATVATSLTPAPQIGAGVADLAGGRCWRRRVWWMRTTVDSE